MNPSELTAELSAIIDAADDQEQRSARIASSIRRFGGYRWVGIYDVGEREIAALGWDGPAPTHPRFGRAEGLCGAAVAAGASIVVGDVRADSRYLTTHQTTRSEIIVPVFHDDVIVGLIDVESEHLHAFGDRDKELLERCAAVIARLWAADSREQPMRASPGD